MLTLTLKKILSYARCHGSSSEYDFVTQYLQPMIKQLGYSFTTDSMGNHYVKVNDDPILFVAHIDTCHTMEATVVQVLEEKNYYHVANKQVGCLGADDGVGIYTNLRMIQAGVGGTYLFTVGEEKGLIGASFIADTMQEWLSSFLMCVEVDRAGEYEIITHQATGKGASDEFAEALADELDMGHLPSNEGVFTDNSEFNTFIPECVNVAAGYIHQHTASEKVNFVYVEKLVDQLLKVNWLDLPVVREVTDCDHGWGLSEWYGNAYDTDDVGVDTEGYPVANEWDDYVKYVEANIEKVVYYLHLHNTSVKDIEHYWKEGEI